VRGEGIQAAYEDPQRRGVEFTDAPHVWGRIPTEPAGEAGLILPVVASRKFNWHRRMH